MKIVNFLLKHNATVNDKDDSDRTALYLSAGRGHLAVVQALVGQGASVNMRCKDGRTALVMSAGNTPCHTLSQHAIRHDHSTHPITHPLNISIHRERPRGHN